MASKRARKRRPAAKAVQLDDLPPLIAEKPPEIQLLNERVMRADWNDPSDSTPNASRTARQVSGHRAFCPLRWCVRRHGERSQITAKHVLAADHLRRLADGILFGFNGNRNPFLYSDMHPGPLLGPPQPALRRARCWKPFVRAMALFTQPQRRLVTAIVLLNRSVSSWVEELADEGRRVVARVEMQKLVVCLDALAEHFDREIQSDLDRGAIAA
jgi:hypothetical protein